ncbi:phenylalanine 4-monooxygenase [Dongia sp.]|uniref:phenylalanine 4-monooxygenase n=1 Tax=Dongia sp. TaxID=1977262 RepID=UPI00375174F5
MDSYPNLRGDYSQMATDYTIAQDWARYTEEEHARWRMLYARQAKLLKRFAAQEFIDGTATLDAGDGIPDLEIASARLSRATGWRLVAVPGLIPETDFFAHLARRQFPVTNWIRKADEIDYLVEPDIFHDFFGHVPLLFNPVFADYMQLYGEKGAEAEKLGTSKILVRLYWYMVEFGLIRTDGGLKAYGAGMLSSAAETRFSIEDKSPNRLRFDLKRVMRTSYKIDDFQETYFVLDSFDELFEATRRDFAPLYELTQRQPEITPDRIVAGDRVITLGDGSWKQRRDQAA